MPKDSNDALLHGCAIRDAVDNKYNLGHEVVPVPPQNPNSNQIKVDYSEKLLTGVVMSGL
jgi:hypothetical protein